MENVTTAKHSEGNVLISFFKIFCSFLYKKINNIIDISANYTFKFTNKWKHLKENNEKLLYIIVINLFIFLSVCLFIIKYTGRNKKQNPPNISTNVAYKKKEKEEKKNIPKRKGSSKKKETQETNNKMENIKYDEQQYVTETINDSANDSNYKKEISESGEDYKSKKPKKKGKKKVEKKRKKKDMPLTKSSTTNSMPYVDVPLSNLSLKQKEKEKAILDQKKKTKGKRGRAKKNLTANEETDEPHSSRSRMTTRKRR
ncbi:conserved Plasmodium protein, unknown function [Plasmodium malariae]|uniref:Uncharacterized protein n=1 Tax=Plasmodium malariae TaxID=5858 RepID=A0A1A8XA32_PLAMA|nr:conserved Plasmodium protein, unknown function [Plasmodium malariae]